MTARLANTLATAVGGDLYEIEPAKPYTSADLNWNNNKSRSSVEMNDPASRPAIAAPVADMEQYDTIFVGFPHLVGRSASHCTDLPGKLRPFR